MKKRYSLLLLIPLILSSCWWFGEKHVELPNYPIAGAKWQEVKLWVYHKTYDGFIFSDTTYQQSAFDTLNYVQFFNDGTLKINSDVYLPLVASGQFSDPPPTPQYSSYSIASFIPWRSLYLIDPSAFHADTVYYNGKDSLRIHSFMNNNLYYNEADAYYTR